MQDGVVSTLRAQTHGHCPGPLHPRRGAAELLQFLPEREAEGRAHRGDLPSVVCGVGSWPRPWVPQGLRASHAHVPEMPWGSTNGALGVSGGSARPDLAPKLSLEELQETQSRPLAEQCVQAGVGSGPQEVRNRAGKDWGTLLRCVLVEQVSASVSGHRSSGAGECAWPTTHLGARVSTLSPGAACCPGPTAACTRPQPGLGWSPVCTATGRTRSSQVGGWPCP